MLMNNVIFSIILFIAIALAVQSRKLTILGGVAASAVAICIYLGMGFSGIALLGSFFILGVLATSWKKNEKRRLRLVEANNQQRNERQVLANGGFAALLGVIAWMFPDYQIILHLMLACSLSSATADTLSSELGVIAGKKFYNILTWKADTKGENGVISLEGTLCGLIGSLLIAFVFAATVEWNLNSIIVIIVAGTIGNLFDSVLGATLERNHIIDNNAVNFLNTFIAALAGAVLA